ncbi:MAG: hypothetical protein IJX87_00195 [Clostridia bacterium]|nr:hypothetical protein [Clostridia bacterium]
MRKNNKAVLLLLCGVMGIATLGFSACGKGGNENVISTTPPAVEELNPTLSLNVKNVTLPLFSKTTIVATLKNSTETIVWTTSDASVVTVENGEIYGCKEGTATITATAGSLSETCSVTVTKEGVETKFAMLEDGMTLYLGSPYKLDPTVVSNDVVVEGVEVTFATEGNVFTIDGEGNVTALKEGEQELTATAVLNGVTVLNATYTVIVREYLSIKTDIDENTLTLKLTNYLADSLTEYSVEHFKAVVGSEMRDDITFTYEVADNTVAKVEDEKILPLKSGETTVSVSFESPMTDNVYTAKIKVVVEKETVAKQTDFLAKSATGTKKSDFENDVTGVTAIDLTGAGIDLTSLVAVREKGNTLVATADGNTLNVTDASCGDVQLEVELEKVVYTIDGFIAQTLISSKADLQKFYTQYGSLYGYTVLTEDIDMGGDVLNGGTQWFRCIFDGRGHTISNFITPYGIVTYISEGALIKNVQYVNVVKDAGEQTEFNNENIGAYGLFGYQHTGSVSDVLVVGTIKNPAEKQAVFCGGEYSKASYTNVVIAFDVDYAENSTLIGTGAYYSGTGTNNILDNMRYVYDGEMLTCADYGERKDSLHYTSVSQYVATKDFDGFDGYWNVSQNDLPVMSDLTEIFENSRIMVDGNFEAGATVTVSTTMACSEIVLKNAVNGVTFDGNTLTIATNVALGTPITLVFTNSLNDVKIEKTYTIRASETLTYTGQYVDAMNGQGKLNLSKLGKDIGEVQSVMINGVEKDCETKNGILYYDTAETGNVTLVLTTETCAYTVDVLQADNVITTAEEFIQWGHKDKGNFAVGTYTVLANDIKTSGWQYFGGFPQGKIFDGLGHTVDGFMGGMGIVRYLDGGTTTWKNVNYINYSGEAVFYQILGGVYENITITGTVNTGTGALLGFTINRANTVIKNCTFDVTHTTAGTALNLAKKGSVYNDLTLIDTTVIYSNGQLTTTDLDLSKGSNYYLYDADDVIATSYYAKVSGGTATFVLSQMGEDAPTTVSKLLVNGVETQATVAGGALSYPATNVGATTLTMATDKGGYVMTIVHADNVITTAEEFIQWGHKDKGNFTVGTYTVLANDIKTSGTQYFGIFPAGCVFDGLGHTVDGFVGGMGIVRYLDGGTTTWKNVNYTNYSGEAVFYQILGGVYENITITGTVNTGTGALLGFTINRANTVINKCTFNLNHATAGTALNLAKKGSAYNDLTLIDTTVTYGNGQLTTTDLDLSKGSNYHLYDVDDVNAN